MQLTMAEGARVRVRVDEAELDAALTQLVEHAADLLRPELEANPWYKEPLEIAISRAQKHLLSEQLSLDAQLAVSAIADSAKGTFVRVEGSAAGQRVAVEGPVQ